MFRSLIEGIRGAISEGRGKADWRRVEKRAARHSARQAAKVSVRDIDPNDYEPGDIKPQVPLKKK